MAKQGIDNYIQEWLLGNEKAFDGILDFYYPKLLVSSLKTVASREDAEELVMNTLLKIWQYKLRLHEVRQFDDYLFGILRQEIVKLSRKRMLITENIDDQSLNNLGSAPHPEFSLKEALVRYQTALDKLSPKQREVFLALREHDLSRKEAAEKTGLSVHTVNSHMNTALKILRQELKEYPEVLVGILISSSTFLR